MNAYKIKWIEYLDGDEYETMLVKAEDMISAIKKFETKMAEDEGQYPDIKSVTKLKDQII